MLLLAARFVEKIIAAQDATTATSTYQRKPYATTSGLPEIVSTALWLAGGNERRLSARTSGMAMRGPTMRAMRLSPMLCSVKALKI